MEPASHQERPREGKAGVLLVNLGTPAAPRAREVGRYLRQFLSDPAVIDIPGPLRFVFVNADRAAALRSRRGTRRSGPSAARRSCSTGSI
jgi:hypothetical protein